MDSKLKRKEAIREYKERKVPRGVFAVRCTPTGGVWVDLSPNLDAARNGVWFCLRLGNYQNRALQATWNTHGEQAFQFEILEKLDDDAPPLQVADLLKEKKLRWLKELNAHPLSSC